MYTNVCTADTSSFSHDNFVCQYYARNAPPKIMKTKHFDKGLLSYKLIWSLKMSRHCPLSLFVNTGHDYRQTSSQPTAAATITIFYFDILFVCFKMQVG